MIVKFNSGFKSLDKCKTAREERLQELRSYSDIEKINPNLEFMRKVSYTNALNWIIDNYDSLTDQILDKKLNESRKQDYLQFYGFSCAFSWFK